jgi:hypothetical protein
MSQIPNMNLPVKAGDDFVGELETMDLTELKDKQYFVAVSQGDRSDVKFVCSTLRGVFTFEEMCEAVGGMWKEHQHHAKVIVAQKDLSAKPIYLDENTVDYIEAHFQDIITESMLEGVFDEDKEYTCRAGVLTGTGEDNPLDADKLAEQEKTKQVEVEDEDL